MPSTCSVKDFVRRAFCFFKISVSGKIFKHATRNFQRTSKEPENPERTKFFPTCKQGFTVIANEQ